MFKKKIPPFVFIFAIFILVLISMIATPILDNRIRKNHTVVCGTIISLSSSGKNLNVIFEFEFNDKLYSHNWSCPKNVEKNYKNGIRSCYIIIEKGDPELCKILDEPSDFEKYNVIPNDTLNLICGAKF